MTIAITGHRPNKLDNDYEYTSPLSLWIISQLQELINQLKPTRGISGMALGIDQIWARLLITNNIPFIAAIPCYQQDAKWPNRSRSRYADLLNSPLCTKHLVSEVYYNMWCMQTRNEWMVDQLIDGDKLIAVWDGTPGGTCNCVNYALNKIGTANLIYINPNSYRFKPT